LPSRTDSADCSSEHTTRKAQHATTKAAAVFLDDGC